MLYSEPHWTVRIDMDFGELNLPDCSVIEVEVQAADKETAIARATVRVLSQVRSSEVRQLISAEKKAVENWTIQDNSRFQYKTDDVEW